MDILKRVINLIFALLIMFWTWLVIWVADPTLQHYIDHTFEIFRGFALIMFITAVINFSLFKKFTIWNK